MFIDRLRPNAGEIESDGKRPSIFTNVCAINYTAKSLFEYQLNDKMITISRWPGRIQPCRCLERVKVQKRMGSTSQNKCRKWNQYTLPSCNKNMAQCKPYHPHIVLAVSKSKQNGNRIKPIIVLPFFFSTGITRDYIPNVVIMYFIGLALIAASVITSSINHVLH